MRRRLTASRLELAEACPGSHVLPWAEAETEWMEAGTIRHRYLYHCATVGREAALSLAPADYVDEVRDIDLSDLPVLPGAYAAEVAFAYDLSSGRARELGRGLSREQAYAQLSAGEIGGTADVVALLGEDGVYVADWKGWAWQAPAERHFQIGFYALAAARAYRRRRAVVELIYLRHGVARRDRAELDGFALDALAERLERVDQQLEIAGMALDGSRLEVRAGRWCQRCPALRAGECPAHARLALQLAKPDVLAEQIRATLRPDTAARAAHLLFAAEAQLATVRSALFAFASTQDVDLGNGAVLGLIERRPKEYVRGEVVEAVLRQLHGPEVAEAAITRSIQSTKSAIKDALRPVAAKSGEKVTHLEARAMAAIRSAKGVTLRGGGEYVDVHPKGKAS